MLSAMIQCGRTNTQKAILLPCGKNFLFFFKCNLNKKMTLSENLVDVLWTTKYFSFYLFVAEPYSVCTFISSQLVLLLSVLYSLCRYGSLLGNPILMHLLFIHNIIKSVPSGRVHFLIFRLVYHFLHNIASLAS